jgi:hypothetical protein
VEGSVGVSAGFLKPKIVIELPSVRGNPSALTWPLPRGTECLHAWLTLPA